ASSDQSDQQNQNGAPVREDAAPRETLWCCGTLLSSTANNCNAQCVGMVTARTAGCTPSLALPAGAPPCAPNITGLLRKGRGMQEWGRRWKEGELEREKKKVVRRTSRSRCNFKSSPSPGY
ncbi:hypothetical protein IRJ41_014887, partial [Triplophysa rosa]